RGGPSVQTPAGRAWWVWAQTDPRSAVSLDGGVSHGWNEDGGRSSSGWAGVTIKPATNMSLSGGPAIDRSDANAQYITTAAVGAAGPAAAPHYGFAALRANAVALTARLNALITPRV